MTGKNEIFDVVNEKNEVISHEERHKIHEKGSWKKLFMCLFSIQREICTKTRCGQNAER
jgi:hypothetical protein